MSWWTHLPSLTPVKGLSRFLYVWTHWEQVSAELKERDNRLRSVEKSMRQIMRLREETLSAENRKLIETSQEVLDELGEAVIILAAMLNAESRQVQASAIAIMRPSLTLRVARTMEAVRQLRAADTEGELRALQATKWAEAEAYARAKQSS